MPSSRGSSRLRNRTCVSHVSCVGRWVLYHLHHLGNLGSPLVSPEASQLSWEVGMGGQVLGRWAAMEVCVGLGPVSGP